MIMSDINTDYFSDKGHSYGGKYILYTKFMYTIYIYMYYLCAIINVKRL